MKSSSLTSTGSHWLTGLFYLAVTGITWLVSDHVFFWDTVQLGAKHATWYYEQQFSHFFLPVDIDSGHPPYFGMYLATWWLIAGKNLLVSHFAMLPFLLLIISCFYRIGEYLAPKRGALLVLLVFADPVLAAQSILVSPDIALIAFFGLALYGVMSRRQLLLSLGILGLGMVSLRGMMIGLGIYVFDLFLHRPKNFRLATQAILPYLPGGVAALLFLCFHYHYLGWIGYHADSPWAPSFERVGPTGIARNAAIVCWRLMDYGRIAVFVLVGFLIYRAPPTVRQKSRSIIVLIAALAFFLLPSVLLHRFLSAHRYLQPLSIALELLAFHLLFQSSLTSVKRVGPLSFFSFTLVVLITGNLWIYPRGIAQGWDATLAHLPYYQLREELWDEVRRQGIPPEQIGTAFPEIGPLHFRDPASSGPGFAGKDLDRQEYIFYSNVMNDFSDEELAELQGSWQVWYRCQKNGIIVLLYRKK